MQMQKSGSLTHLAPSGHRRVSCLYYIRIPDYSGRTMLETGYLPFSNLGQIRIVQDCKVG